MEYSKIVVPLQDKFEVTGLGNRSLTVTFYLCTLYYYLLFITLPYTQYYTVNHKREEQRYIRS